jgi:ribosome biogenesis GTPase
MHDDGTPADADHLEGLGWTPSRAVGLEHQLARVAVEHRGFYDVLGMETDPYELTEGASVTAPMRRAASSPLDFPAVGDWVDVERAAGPNDSHVIHRLVPRTSLFVRRAPGREPKPQVVGANIDTVLVVSSLDGDLNPRRLERYLAVVWGGGATPIVVLSKSDQVSGTAGAEELVRTVAGGVDIVVSSIESGEGIEAVRALLPYGSTAAVVGSSGVGKSSLINELLGDEVQNVAATQRDGRGRHTTIRRHLIPMPGAGLIVDTPGMREVQLWDGAGLPNVFPEIFEAAQECRFSDCSHRDEPNCAVIGGLRDGTIDSDRMEGLNRLQAELDDLDDEIERRRRGRRDQRR